MIRVEFFIVARGDEGVDRLLIQPAQTSSRFRTVRLLERCLVLTSDFCVRMALMSSPTNSAAAVGVAIENAHLIERALVDAAEAAVRVRLC